VQWWHPIAAPALWTCIAGRRSRTVVVCHNLRPHERALGALTIARRMLADVRAIVCHCAVVQREIGRLVPGAEPECTAMPLLADPSAGAAPRSTAAVSAHPRALFLGLIREYKGVDLLLRAWGEANLPGGAVLTIAGESYLGDGKLERIVRESGASESVRVIERYLTDGELCGLLRESDLLVLPYRAASQSGLIPLALAAGVRILATDAGGLAEPLRGDPRHRIVAAGDSSALRAALEDILCSATRTSGDASQHQELDPGAVSRSWDGLVAALERIGLQATR